MTQAAPMLTQKIFGALTDGQLHSGEALAEATGVTRSAVWKAISQLRGMGLLIEAQTNRGYRLGASCEALNVSAIRGDLPKEISDLAQLEVVWEIGSTNARLLESQPPTAGEFAVLLAENQTGGRGRRGRRWQAALGDSLCLSIATNFEPLPHDLPALSLVVGTCVREALLSCGVRDISLKWPNDVVILSASAQLVKLGGILVELRAEAVGPALVVVGIGLNLRLGEDKKKLIAESGTLAGDLESLGLDAGKRNAVAAAIIGRVIAGLKRFAVEGFAPFIEDWRAADVLCDQPIRVLDGSSERQGIARGIDAQGALQLEHATGHRSSILAGEISVRT